LLDRVSTIVLGLDGSGKAQAFADYSQWAADQATPKPTKPKTATPRVPAAAPSKKKLSYLESREYESIEERIAVLEDTLHAKHMSVEEVALKEPRSLEKLYKEIEAAQQEVDLLYARWAELEEKAG
jgi:ATP-binding cassette subfamily F protein uup